MPLGEIGLFIFRQHSPSVGITYSGYIPRGWHSTMVQHINEALGSDSHVTLPHLNFTVVRRAEIQQVQTLYNRSDR